MKYKPDSINGPTIQAYGPGWVQIDQTIWRSSALVSSSGAVQAWACCRFEDLSEGDFAQLAALDPEVVLLGTGAHQRFVHPALTQTLALRQLGLDVMDTHAACRTYNVLAAEGRRVAVALLIEPQTPSGNPQYE